MQVKKKLRSIKDKISETYKDLKKAAHALFNPERPFLYVGKDGAHRTVTKLQWCYENFKEKMKPLWKEFLAKPNGHNWTDLFVESARHHAYFVGHIYAVLLPLLIIFVPILLVLLIVEEL